MNRILTRSLCAAAAALLIGGLAADSRAQCDTCATPVTTVAYAPTVTLEPYNGWYPGKLLDRMRMRRWERNAAATYSAAYAPAYSTSYAPAYSASYAPTYTAAYAPTSYTAAYTPYNVSYAYSASYSPYVTAYAPLQRNVQTTYYRAAVLTPVVADAGCSACSACDPCGSYADGGCSACSAGVSQAGYDAPVGGCASCAADAGTPAYDYGAGAAAGPDYGQANTQPQLTEPPTPAGSQYGTQRPPVNGQSPEAANGDEEYYPGPASEEPAEEDADANGETTMYPRLLSPVNDRTANRPTVDVWNAVYHKPAVTRQTSLRQPAPQPQPQRQRTQAEIDADPWHGAGQ